MAGTDPYQTPDDPYSPLRQHGYQPPVNPDQADPAFMNFMEALRLQAEDFSIPDLPERAAPPAEPDEAYRPPETVEEARAALDVSERNLSAYRQQLDAFAEETRNILPLTDESSAEIIRRAKLIAMERRDLAANSQSLASSRKELELLGQTASEDPAWWQSALGYAGKATGAVGWLLEHSPLGGMVETVGGFGSYAAQTLAKLTGEKRIGQSSYGYSFKDYAQDMNPLNVAWSALGFDPSSDLRKRGREFYKEAGQGLGSFEKEVILTTPVMGQLWKYSPREGLAQALQGLQITGKTLAGQPFAPLSEAEKDTSRDQFYEMGLMAMTDPLNLVDFGAPLTRLGKLRGLASANRGALETGALVKSLNEVPEIGAALGKDAYKAVESGELVNELRKAGISGDEAERMAKQFDLTRKTNFKDLRDLASTDPQAWGNYVRGLVEEAPGKGTVQRGAQLNALDKIAEFGDDVDPILGRTWREQAQLGQRAKVWQRLYENFGDRWWLRMPTKGWARLTGQSLLADIGDNAELMDLYFGQRMFKADAGAEILRYQQDVTAKATDLLNGLNKAEQAELFEQLPRVVEHMAPETRAALKSRKIGAGPKPLQDALFDMADLYDESAETLKAIQNRFGLKVADLGADLGYFGRQFSPELQDWILRNPTAREFLYGDKIKRSRASLSSAFLPEERARKLKDFDFAGSEGYLRQQFRTYGLPDNVKIWSRDAFGNLAERAQKTLHTAEKRNLFASFAEAHAAQVDDAVVNAAQADIIDLIRARQIKGQMKGFEPVEEAVNKAQKARGVAQEAKSGAERAQGAAAEQEGYYAKVQSEMSAAEKRYRDKVRDFEAKGGEYARASTAAKKAKDDYFNAQDIFNKGGEAEKASANKAMQDATKRLKAAAESLSKAKKAGVASPEELAKLQQGMKDAEEGLKVAKANVAEQGPRAKATREAAEKANAEAMRAEEALKAADANLQKSREAMLKNHPDNWSSEAKAQWLLNNLKGKGVLGEFGPNKQQISALEVLLKSKIAPPTDWAELARYAATNLDPKTAEEFGKMAEGLYWRDMQKPGWIGKAYDSLRAIYQRSTLARIPSLAKDLFGTSVNGLMAGNAGYWDRAMKELGTFGQWADPAFRKGSNANKLAGLGVLRTTKNEALDRLGALEELLPSFVGKAAGNIEKQGVVGGVLKSIGASSTGKAAHKVFDKLNAGRQYWEEVNRVATYLKAVDEGADHISAVNEVYKWWGKFDELSKLDRNVLSRVLFFWTWMARSMPVTVAHLFEHPVRSKLLMAMMAGDVDDDKKTPNWLRRMGGWVLGQGENGVTRSINLGGSTYFSPAFAALQGDFANQMMHGKPLDATSGALKDLVRATPPFVQAFGELAQKTDYFTQKDWWKDKNAEAGSNAKAPAALWWIYAEPGQKGGIAALSDLLGLKPVVDRKTGEATHLTMNPAWAWFFGSLPGAEPLATDVSAFFTPPKDARGVPQVDVKKGLMRQSGFPIYDVPVEDAYKQTYEFQKALNKSADGLSGGALSVNMIGQVGPNKQTWRGQQMADDLKRWEKGAQQAGQKGDVAHESVMGKLKLAYPNEWRILTLQERLMAWTKYLQRMAAGEGELEKGFKKEVELLARRADSSRVRKFQDKKLDALLPKDLRR